MKLILDVGNTLTKAGIFEGKTLHEIFNSTELTIGFIEKIRNKYKNITLAILSSLKDVNNEVLEYLKNNYSLIEFTEHTPIPVRNLYQSPSTLGNDRLAGVIAAHTLYPDKNVLVIDAGTCITYDMITADGVYSGGSISPGLYMKFQALHTFTGKLPLIELKDFNEIIGTNTEQSILSGVINGTVGEMDAIIEKYDKLYSPLKTLICGGDAHFLAVRLKSSIFAAPELVLLGLNEILDYNV